MLKSEVNLYEHQKTARDFALNNDGNSALFMEVGTGKTLTSLSIFSELRKSNLKLKMFVFCPISLIEGAWAEDIKKFTRFSYWNIRKKTKRNSLKEFADIWIINYEFLISEKNMRWMYCVLQNHPFIAALDESSKIKNHSSKTTKNMLKLRNLFKHRIVLSGTPAPNNETEYWGQVTFVKDRVFHPNFYAFRNTYFHLQRGNQIGVPQSLLNKGGLGEAFRKGFSYEITNSNRERLLQRMKPICHFVKKDECLDLPEQVDEIRYVEMSDAQAKCYREMKRHCVTEIEDEVKSKNFDINDISNPIVAMIALTKMLKLRQITSGFAYAENGEAKELKTNPKFNDLMQFIDQIGNEQLIIWCHFKPEITKIKNALKEKARCLYGEVKHADRDDNIQGFKNGDFQFLIAHPRSAAHGLTFVNCHLQYFFSLDYSNEEHQQCRGRTHRPGQNKKCTYVYSICENSIDKSILDVLKNKKKKEDIAKGFLS